MLAVAICVPASVAPPVTVISHSAVAVGICSFPSYSNVKLSQVTATSFAVITNSCVGFVNAKLVFAGIAVAVYVPTDASV